MYVVADGDNMYLVHACKKQKGKAEKYELDKAIRRVKELEKELNKRLI
jgi:phage-related protein